MPASLRRSPCRSNSPVESRSRSPELREFLLYLASERGLADNSILGYRRDLEDLEDYLAARQTTLTGAGVDDFKAYLQHQTRQGQSTRTVARRLAAIRVFLRHLAAAAGKGVRHRLPEGPEGCCAQTVSDPFSRILEQLERPKPERSLPRVLSRAQVAKLISAPNPKSFLFDRDVAILELLYASGLRATELCDLKLTDLNLDVGCVRVLGKGMKERIVPVGQAAIEAIKRYLLDCRPRLQRQASDRVFLSRTGKPMERIGLWMLVEKYGRSSGLLNEVHPHTLRHCFATHLLGGGADLRIVQELLGHSDVATTQIYTHVDQDRLKAIHQKFHPRR